jgi:predicted kinase
MLRRARLLLELGESVVLDASWGSAQHREAARALATATFSDIKELACSAPRSLVLDRIAARAGAAHVVSDADAAVAVALADSHEPWPEALTVDTRVDLSRSLDVVVDVVRPVRVPEHRRLPSMMAPD